MHRKDEIRIPNARSTFSFGGESFEAKLIEICVSHNEGAEVLLERDLKTSTSVDATRAVYKLIEAGYLSV